MHSSATIRSKMISSAVDSEGADSEEADSVAVLAPCNRTFLVEDSAALVAADSPPHSRHFLQLAVQDPNQVKLRHLLKMESVSLGLRRRLLINKAARIQL